MHGLHAADEQRADQDQRHPAEIGVEFADDALVAREESRHGARGRGIHAEQIAGNVHGAERLARDRHVDAVIVVGREIDAGEGAIEIGLRGARVGAQQFVQRVVVPLGLQQLAVGDRAALAERAVDGTDDGVVRGIDGPRAGTQCAREKIVEAAIGERIGLRCFRHVHFIAAQEVRDDEPPHRRRLRAHDGIDQA